MRVTHSGDATLRVVNGSYEAEKEVV